MAERRLVRCSSVRESEGGHMPTTAASKQSSPFLIALNREQLDGLPWAITKVNKAGVFTYANRAMCAIVGTETVEGKALADFFHGDDLVAVREHLESRFTRGAADEYEVEAIRPGDHVRVPVRISALPDADERGQTVGAIAIVRDLLSESVAARIHAAIEDERDGAAILRTVASECARVLPFDTFSVSVYSADGDHARMFFLYFPGGEFRSSVRWQEMSAYARKLVDMRQVIIVDDLEEWLNRPEWRSYRDDPDMKRALQMGFRSTVSFPVIRGNRVVATFGFGRLKDKPPFDRQDEERLARLPIRAAVLTALHYQEVDDLHFALDLVRGVAADPDGAESIARTIARKIRAHYHWENVSIFRPDEQAGVLRLVTQDATRQEFRLPADWQHSLDTGVTGHVYRTGATLNVPDVAADAVKDLYLRGIGESRSELCLPIVVAGRVYWVLNIEDASRNAFAKEEIEALESILREVSLVLELVAKTQIFSELVKRSKDAIVQTDGRGLIKEANPAAEDLLGYAETEMKGTAFAAYFKDKEQARRVEQATYVPNDEVRLIQRDGSEVPLLLSGTSLPGEIGLKIYICNDLTQRKLVGTLEILRQMYNEIASQIKTPLSLAFTWLGRLQEHAERGDVAEVAAKTVKQLNKVDLTYDRLLFYERYKTIAPVEKNVFELPVLLAQIRQQMPDSEAARIDVTDAGDAPLVRADLFQVWFSVESVLAYLLRFVAEDGKVSVRVSGRDGKAEVAIRGYAPRVTGGEIKDFAKVRWAVHAITEMALGEGIVRAFIERNHGGRFRKRELGEDIMEYVIELPSA
jgi:PAS domain S-box-containing protein